MPRIKLLPLVLLVALGAHAEDKPDPTLDSAVSASSGLKARAEAVSKRALQALRGTGEDGSKHEPRQAGTPRPTEIGGSGDLLFVTFDMGDGSLAEFTPGQTVPRWGHIKDITPGAVERDDHHCFPPE